MNSRADQTGPVDDVIRKRPTTREGGRPAGGINSLVLVSKIWWSNRHRLASYPMSCAACARSVSSCVARPLFL